MATHLDRVLVREPVRRGRVRQVRGPCQHVGELGLDLLELRIEPLELGRDRGHLGDQALLLVALGAADRPAHPVLLRTQLLDPNR